MARPDTSTRTRLVDVAERMFAEQGIQAVSLRAVGAAAGQSNHSVAQYHFGSKQGLVDAIIESRSAPVDARRAELVDSLVGTLGASGRTPDLRDLVTTLIQPLAETIDGDRQNGRRRTHYLRFLAQALDDPAMRASWRHAASNPPGVTAVVGLLRRLLPDLPSSQLIRRLELSAMINLRILAEHERRLQEAEVGPEALAQTVRELVEMQVALLRCPVDQPAPRRNRGPGPTTESQPK